MMRKVFDAFSLALAVIIVAVPPLLPTRGTITAPRRRR